jgi:hypothetical protein
VVSIGNVSGILEKLVTVKSSLLNHLHKIADGSAGLSTEDEDWAVLGCDIDFFELFDNLAPASTTSKLEVGGPSEDLRYSYYHKSIRRPVMGLFLLTPSGVFFLFNENLNQ